MLLIYINPSLQHSPIDNIDNDEGDDMIHLLRVYYSIQYLHMTFLGSIDPRPPVISVFGV